MQIAITNERLHDTLKLLEYDSQFCEQASLAPVSRHYFAVGTDASSQLHYFANLCSWLFRFQGIDMEPPKEYADPNTVCSEIITRLQKLNMCANTSMSAILKGSGALLPALTAY